MFTRKIYTGISQTLPAVRYSTGPGISKKTRAIFEKMLSFTPGFSEIPSHCLEFSDVRGTSVPIIEARPSKTPFPDLQLVEAFHRSDEMATLHGALRHYKTILNYLRVADKMHHKGLIPLAHGQSAIWMIAQHILKNLEFNHCHSLRLPLEHSMRERVKIAGAIDAEMQRRVTHWLPFYNKITFFKNLDLSAEFRSNLLSVTLGLFHGETMNSPLSFVFGGTVPRGPGSMPCRYPGNKSLMSSNRCVEISNQMIAKALEYRGLHHCVSEDLLAKIQPLYEEAEQAAIGQLIILGVPEHSLQKYVYHSETGGIPTGLPIKKVLENLSNAIIPQQGCQARFLFCRETMDIKSGIEVVNIMNDFEVRSFCEGEEHSSPNVERILSALYNPSHQKPGGELEDCETRNLNQHKLIIDKLDRILENL
jgi:hypothetical protein